MKEVKSITQQLLEATQMRLVWANKEKTRIEIILYVYQTNKNSIISYEFEVYMRCLSRERLKTYYHWQDAAEFWREFKDIHLIYQESEPEIGWLQFLENKGLNYHR